MNAKMEFTSNTLPGITRAASDADKKENEELRKKIAMLKLEADKRKKAERKQKAAEKKKEQDRKKTERE